MPIQDADPDTIASQVLQPHAESNGKAHYVVFFASGKPPWCPDCVRAQPALEKVFGSASGMPILHKILVGERHEWKTSENRWRKAPFQVDQTPTVIKFIDGKEIKRLGDQESQSIEKLEELLQAS